MYVREKDIEEYLVRQVKKRGGVAYKFTSPARRSVPDRLVLWPGGVAQFVELKSPGKKPTEQQAREHARLNALGFPVAVLDSKEAVDEWLNGPRPTPANFDDLLGVVPISTSLGAAIKRSKANG